MLRVDFILNGKPGKSPANQKDFTIDLNFDVNDPEAKVVATNNWRWINERAEEINEYKDAGLTGGTGVHEGMPLDIILSYGTDSYTIKQFLDLRSATFSDFEIECQAQLRGKNDLFNNIVDKATFQYIHEKTSFLPKESFISMPYVINSIPNYKEAFVAALSIFVMAQQLQKVVTDISAAIGESANPMQLATILRIILLVIYAALLLVALVKLVKDLMDLLIQPVKYHACCLVKTQMIAACEFLGFTFKSTIFDSAIWSRLCIMPAKLQNPQSLENEKLLGFLKPDKNSQVGYFDGSPGDLFRAMVLFFNGKFIFEENNVLRFERKDYTTSSPAYIIPDVYQPHYKINADELKSNILIEFETDAGLDKNTIQPFEGNICQIITAPKTVTNKDCNLIAGYEPTSIPFARAARKTELNEIEKLVDAFLTAFGTLLNGLILVVNAVVEVVNKIMEFIEKIVDLLDFFGIELDLDIPEIPEIPKTNFGSILNNRIGMLMLETDFFEVPKIFLIKEGVSDEEENADRENKIDENNNTYVNATYLWNNFHYVTSFVPTADRPNANQWLKKTIERVPFTWQDFQKVKNNNRIFTSDGKVAKITSLKWNVWDQLADIDFMVNEVHTKNLQITLHEPKGY